MNAYGKVPTINTSSQLIEFSSKLQIVRNNSIHEMKPHLYPDGPIVDYGAGHMPGYFLIKLYDYGGNKTTYSENELKEIYNIVEKYSIKDGITEVPVIFSLWDHTAIFYFPEEDNYTCGEEVLQITDIKFCQHIQGFRNLKYKV
ncbi:MAG: hypothetical protein M0Q94_16140 [Candidatus Cloacimonetes bacterium]|nr:hypothetical protein [Candidatus Cloacimonadota bacterium]